MKTLLPIITAAAIILASALTISSCYNSSKAPSDANAEASEEAEPKATPLGRPTAVPFTKAENYFIKNGAKLPDSHKITNKETFDSIFGMATTMGENGKPTEIDFDKNFVIAVETGPVQKETTLIPEYLINHYDGKLVFHYAIKQGEDISYTIRPVLIIIVDKNLANMPIKLVSHS
jgi:hypothetical protein